MADSQSNPAVRAVQRAGLDHEVVSYGEVRDIREASERRGVPLEKIIKTLVVRRGHDDYLFVLVPGDRVIDWPALRRHLAVGRIALADPEEARLVTGYPRGAITPFGSQRELPVVADAAIEEMGTISLGGGARGIAVHLDGSAALRHLGAEVAPITRPA